MIRRFGSDLGRYFGKAADLRTRLTIAEARAIRLREQLTSFEVVPEYKELEREANVITREIDALNVDNVMDGDLLQQLRASLGEEGAPDLGDVTKLYAEAGVVLPDMVRRRFDEVERFHRTIIENRRAHLNAEITSAEARIVERDQRTADRDRRRRQIMNVLSSGGALEHYTNLREEAGRAEAEVDGLRQRLEPAERIESTKAELDIERANLTRFEMQRVAGLEYLDHLVAIRDYSAALKILRREIMVHFENHCDGSAWLEYLKKLLAFRAEIHSALKGIMS